MHENEIKINPKIPFNTAKIDSFTLLIPYENVQIVSSTFTKKYSLLYDETSEIEDDVLFYKNYIKKENKDFATFLKYKKVFRLFNGVNREFIQIMITAKQLRSSYFDGINKCNINLIFNQIIADEIIFLEYDEFLKSYVTDIDICKDYNLGLDEFKGLKKFLEENILDSKSKVVHSKRINSKESFGIQYNERSTATPTKPFAKLYYKTNEIFSEKNRAFLNTNLVSFLEVINSGISRVEVTIKNSRHKKHLKIDGLKILDDLLNLSLDDLNFIHKNIFNEYYENNIVEPTKPKERMSVQKLISIAFIKKYIKANKDVTKAELISIAQLECTDKQQRYSVKKEIDELIKIAIDDLGKNDVINANEIKYKNRNIVLKDLGIFD